jgi:hypothetical protein
MSKSVFAAASRHRPRQCAARHDHDRHPRSRGRCFAGDYSAIHSGCPDHRHCCFNHRLRGETYKCPRKQSG